MANSLMQIISDGSLSTIPLTIKFCEQSHIKVFINNTALPDGTYTFAWSGATTITITPAVAAGAEVSIRRKTPANEVLHDFQAGAVFSEVSVDENFLQELFLLQEASEQSLVTDLYTDLDMHGNRIRNMANAVLPSDAVTLQQATALAEGGGAFTLRTELASAVGLALTKMRQPDAPVGSALIAAYDMLAQFRDVIKYGADPTGVALSDDAFEAAFGDPYVPCCVWLGVPLGKGKATYRISKLVWMAIRKQLRGAGSDLVEIVVDNADLGSCPRAIVGDAYSHASGFTIRNAQPSISRSAMVSNSQTTSNGWRDGSMYDIHIKDFDYCIDGWNGLTLGLMFSNVYEKITFENYKTALRVGAGSNNNTYIGLTWLNGQVPIQFNNATTMKFIGGAIEAHTGFDAIIEASSSIHFDSVYFEPSNGISSTGSTGSLKNCHMTNQTVANFLLATSDSHWTVDDIFDENAAGAATPGAQAWYIYDAGSSVRLFNGRVGAGGVKTQRNGDDGYVQEVRRDIPGWYVQKFANGELEMHYSSEAAGDPIMTGAVGTFERALTPPVAFTGYPVAIASVFANAANSFLLQESPTITARPRVDGTIGVAAKRAGITFPDGYYFCLSVRGRWR